MNRRKSSKLAIALAMISIPVLSGCGSSNNGGAPAGNGQSIIGYTTQCNAYGQCTQVPIYGTPGGCVPLNQAIAFTGTAQMSGNNLVAGQSLGGGSLTVAGSGALTTGTNMITSVIVGTNGPDSQLSFSLSGGGSYYTYGGSSASITGALQLGPYWQQRIAADYYMYSGGGYGGYGVGTQFLSPTVSSPYGTAACISQIGLIGQLYQSMPVFAGKVALYLNNSNFSGYLLAQ